MNLKAEIEGGILILHVNNSPLLLMNFDCEDIWIRNGGMNKKSVSYDEVSKVVLTVCPYFWALSIIRNGKESIPLPISLPISRENKNTTFVSFSGYQKMKYKYRPKGITFYYEE